MSKIFINEFKEGLSIKGTYLCAHKALLKDKNGKPYLNLKLMDRTGVMEARIWERAPLLAKNFNKLDYVQVKGNVISFQDHLQFNISDILAVDEKEVDTEDFLPHTSQDISEMYETLLKFCQEEFKNENVKKLLLSILEDPQLRLLIQRSPAAKSNHHAWIGGLLEHVLKLCQVGKDTLKHYPMVNSDLVLAGLILHDLGKVYELSAEKYFEYTDRGYLIGHLVIGVEIIIKKASQIPNFPQKILNHLEHIILSHHGHLEHGSPIEPMTLEALMVHHLDNMDSKIQGFLDILARETEGDPTWSSSGFIFKRPLYKRTKEDMEGKETEAKSSKPPTKEVPDIEPPKKNESKIDQETSPKPKPATKKFPPQKDPKEREKRRHSKEPLKTNLGELLQKKLKEGT